MIFIILISIILYLLAGTIIYHNISSFDKDKKIKFILIGFMLIFIVTYIICIFTAKDLEYAKQLVNITQITSTLLFAPLNSILYIAPMGNILSKLKSKEIDDNKLKRRVLIFAVIGVVALIVEFNYIKNFQLGLLVNTGR